MLPSELSDIKTALINQLPELAESWWRRVRKELAKDEPSETVLKLLMAEAQNRIDHASQKVGKAILRTLIRLVGLNPDDVL